MNGRAAHACLPFYSLVLYLAICVVEGQNDSVYNLRTCMVVGGEERRRPCIEQATEIIQGHVSQICVCIAEVWEAIQALSR